jgi:hypothetical protein
MPSGDDPMGGHRFSLEPNKRGLRLRGDHAQTTSWSAMTVHPELVALRRDDLTYRDVISRQRAARSPVKASRRSSIGQALPR